MSFVYEFATAFLLFAEGEAKEGGEAQQQPMGWLWMLMIGVFILYYFVVLRPGRGEKQRREDMLNSLKKNDRVITIGGIIGTVASVSQDGREVTLKIDDNARIKVLRSAIQGPLKDMEKKDATETGQETALSESAK